MINFQQLCELLTHNQRYSWFWFPSDQLNQLTQEERALIYITNINETECQIFYPKEKFFTGLDKKGLTNEMMKALENGDLELVKAIKERMK